MLSVLIETLDDEDGLARTLASLVGGAVEGVVRDVVVCDAGSTDRTLYVAEHAGCTWVVDGLAVGIRQARGDWLLLVEPGARLVDGWTEAVVEHAARHTLPACFQRSRTDRAPLFSRFFGRRRALERGLLISRRQAEPLSRTASGGEALARGLAVRRLAARIEIAPQR